MTTFNDFNDGDDEGKNVNIVDSVTPANKTTVDSSGDLHVTAKQNGTWNITNISGVISLPTGASTSALQTTGNTSLASIDTKTPTLGQKAMTGSTPVVIASDQSAIPVSQSGTWNITNISGTVSLPTGASTSALQTTGNTSLASIDAGIPAALGAATIANSMPVNIASDQVVPISATALPLPSGASTSALQTTGNTSLSSIDTKLTSQATAANQVTGNNSLSSIDGKLTLNFGTATAALRMAAQLGNATGSADFNAGTTSAQTLRVVLPTDQTAIPASQSGTWNITNISGTISLPTGASTSALQTTGNTSLSSIDTKLSSQATAANQTTGNTSLSSIDTKTPTLGQKTMANSSPIVIASDQSAIPVSQSGTWNITNISGTVSLPTGASTSALQTSGNASLTSIDGKLVDGFGVATAALRTAAQLGNASGSADFNAGTTSAQTLRVVLPTDQTAIPSSQSGTWNITNISGTISLPTGASTAANQATEIASLATIATNTSNTNTSVQNTQGTVVPGTVATKSELIGGQYNSTLPTLTNAQQSAVQLDSSGRLIIAPLTNTSIIKVQLQDNAGNALSANNSQLLVKDVLNTAGQSRAQSVTTSAAEALGAATILANRKVLTITPTNGTVYWGYANTVTISSGTPIFKNQFFSINTTDNVHIYVIAASTVDCRITEGS